MIAAAVGYAVASWLLDGAEEPLTLTLADLFNTDPLLRGKVEARGKWRGSSHWIWTGARQAGGAWGASRARNQYGRVRRRGDLWLAHRWVYRLIVGRIERDHHVHHLCGNTLCVNPAHLDALHEDKHAELHAEIEAAEAVA